MLEGRAAPPGGEALLGDEARPARVRGADERRGAGAELLLDEARVVVVADVALEGLTLFSSALRAGFPSSNQLLPADVHVVNALCAFWVGLVALSCSRSKWIELPPPAARGSQYGYSGGG